MNIVAFARVDGHHIIAWLVIGLIAGVLASLVVRGTGLGFVRDIIVGLIGAVIGGLVLHAVTHIVKVFDRSRGRSMSRR
jgi:uncharacterized membrane protein YeaQ/YmgE (transglycosylase-associated protein family)